MLTRICDEHVTKTTSIPFTTLHSSAFFDSFVPSNRPVCIPRFSIISDLHVYPQRARRILEIQVEKSKDSNRITQSSSVHYIVEDICDKEDRR